MPISPQAKSTRVEGSGTACCMMKAGMLPIQPASSMGGMAPAQVWSVNTPLAHGVGVGLAHRVGIGGVLGAGPNEELELERSA